MLSSSLSPILSGRQEKNKPNAFQRHTFKTRSMLKSFSPRNLSWVLYQMQANWLVSWCLKGTGYSMSVIANWKLYHYSLQRNGWKNPLVEQKSLRAASARDLKLGSLWRKTFELIFLYDHHFRAWPLNFCNLSGAIYVSAVKNWVCYSKTAPKAGNRTVGEELKVVTVEAIEARYAAPADTDSSCLLWRQLVKTVKAWFTYVKRPCFDGLQGIQHKTRKKPNTALCPYRGLLGIGFLGCWFCHLLDDGSNVCRPVQLQLGKAALISLHNTLYSWREKPHKRQINVEHITTITLV